MDTFIKRWQNQYNTEIDVGDTLTEAQELNLKFYKHQCKTHGTMLFYTKDNSCPVCCKVARDKRRVNDRIFNRSRELFNESKQRASKKGMEHTITKEDIRELFGPTLICPIFETMLNYSAGDRSDDSPSLDRIDSSKGYVKSNIAIISERANRIKNNGTADEHRQIADWMYINIK